MKETSRVTPPPGFKPVRGRVQWAIFAQSGPPLLRASKPDPRTIHGVRYERAAHKHFLGLYGDYYIPNPWIIFRDEGKRRRWCQPDALLFNFYLGTITILEMKYRHTDKAWWQLMKLYLPVMQHIFPGWKFPLVEVVKYYDPSVNFPGGGFLMKCPEEAVCTRVGTFKWDPSSVQQQMHWEAVGG